MNGEFLNDELLQSFASSVRDVNESEMLPPGCYSNEDFYEFEKQALFSKEWLCVGRESDVPNPGDYLTITYIGEPLIIVRTRDNVIKALSAVCQHRAMLVAEGKGNQRAFVCPYHHWTYSLDGDLVAAPEMDRACEFDKKANGLPELRVELWQGFVFINFDADAEPLAPRLSVVTAAIERHEIGSALGMPTGETVHYPWNWKVQYENNNDGYHANRLHQGPLHDFIPSALASFPVLPENTAGYFRYNGALHQDAAFTPTTKAMFKIFPRLTTEDRSRVMFCNVPPSMTMLITSDMVLYSILRPEGPTTTAMNRGLLFAPGVREEPLFKERVDAMMGAVASISAQDRHVDALVQKGLQSRYAKRGRYSWQEQSQSELNKWLVRRYAAGWAERGAPIPAPRSQVVNWTPAR
ncbi:aromatic ring-hydroxylating dioxygenase subunit alpha [soil metagenome]